MLKVAQTGGVSSTGAWRSLPEGDFTQTVEEQAGLVVYTWRLKEGRTVPAGQWMFAGQYDHARGGRDAKGDSYTITGAAEGRMYSVTGDLPRSRENSRTDHALPAGPRHGTVLPVTGAGYERLLRTYG